MPSFVSHEIPTFIPATQSRKISWSPAAFNQFLPKKNKKKEKEKKERLRFFIRTKIIDRSSIKEFNLQTTRYTRLFSGVTSILKKKKKKVEGNELRLFTEEIRQKN